jgi:hypothetical protein
MPLLIYSRQTRILKLVILLYYIAVIAILTHEVGFVTMAAGNPYYALFCGKKFPVPELTGNSAERL